MMIDVNVSLSRWPFRRLKNDESRELVAALRYRGVTQAWVGSFDGLLHKDIAGVNARLAADCKRYGPGFLLPFGSINPTLPDWQEDLWRCKKLYWMPGIRLHPNYHGYSLSDPPFVEVLTMATSERLIVQLALRMEDDRTQHPLLRVSPVDIEPLSDIVRGFPGLRLVVLNSTKDMNYETVRRLAGSGEVYFDIAMMEGIYGVNMFATTVSPQRVLFGSHFPLFYFESAFLKMCEAALPEDDHRAVIAGNARRLLEMGSARREPSR